MRLYRRTPRRLATALAVLCLSMAGGSVRAHTPRACTEEIADLRRKMVDLQRRATVGEVEVARLRQEIARLERELQAARERSAADTSRAPIEDVETGPIVLTSGVEESELEEEPRPPPDDPAPPADGGEPPPLDAGAPPAQESPETLALYDEGYTLYHQRRYGEAEERFRRYLTLYPQTELADNAQFWIGECHYARRDFAAALEAFTTTVERYPDGNKVADALLKAGKCLEALGRVDQARETYHEVTDRFPTAAAAVIARERLAALP